jgi:methylated-DNA-[protein]-cysteine S-methyltransferase
MAQAHAAAACGHVKSAGRSSERSKYNFGTAGTDGSVTLFYKPMASPVGELKLVAEKNALVAVLWDNERENRVRLGAMTSDPGHPLLIEAQRQLEEYFCGRRTAFDLSLDLRGSQFQRRVWQALRRIPFGATRTYAAIARELGVPRAARAVGAANGRNPLAIVVPCHRMIGADGALTGFAGGIDIKARLLDFEAGRAASFAVQEKLF